LLAPEGDVHLYFIVLRNVLDDFGVNIPIRPGHDPHSIPYPNVLIHRLLELMPHPVDVCCRDGG
jgi:hypothetical protein